MTGQGWSDDRIYNLIAGQGSDDRVGQHSRKVQQVDLNISVQLKNKKIIVKSFICTMNYI